MKLYEVRWTNSGKVHIIPNHMYLDARALRNKLRLQGCYAWITWSGQ